MKRESFIAQFCQVSGLTRLKPSRGFMTTWKFSPLATMNFMIRNQTVSTHEDLKLINREIVELGEKLEKPVVATCDVHFINPEDAVYREVLFTGQDYDDAANQAPLYFRTTDEMLEEFAVSRRRKRHYEVVVENTNMIADMVEKIPPVPDGTFPPEYARRCGGSDQRMIGLRQGPCAVWRCAARH